MLFAESDAVTGTSVGVVVTALIASGGMLGTAILTYLTNRDKLRHDVKMQVLEQQVVTCERQHKEDEAEVKAAKERAEAAAERLARVEGERAGLERENASQRAEIADLRDRLNRTYGSGKAP